MEGFVGGVLGCLREATTGNEKTHQLKEQE